MREKYGFNDIIWVGPKSALVAAKTEFQRWKSSLAPNYYTYEGMRDLVEHWPSGRAAPKMFILDEASKVKNPTSKRAQAAQYIADTMRNQYGFDCVIGLLSGTPAPKSPADWWKLCEIGCPGFIREGHVNAFRSRLAIIEKRETIPGAGKYDHIVAWKDSENKCSVCGMPKEHANHQSDGMARFLSKLGNDISAGQTYEVHDFKQCTNEVAKLKTRLRGLVGVWLKEDCLDLPPKRYEVIRVKPSRATLNAAKIITQSSGRAIEALTLLRELSDGFQYVEVKTGNVIDCRVCNGSGKIKEYYNPSNPSLSFTEEEIREGVRFIYETDDDGEEKIIGKEKIEIIEFIKDCTRCNGGKVDETRRDISEVDCPKDQVLIDKLEMNEEHERFNIYGGFTGTIDRVAKICMKQGWGVIKADGRGWSGLNANGTPILHPNGDKFSSEQLYQLYRGMWSEQYTAGPLAFDGQPGAAGMGLTLTVARTTMFFSNDFNGENREQAEDRGHRIGMDVDRGGWITDIIHLPTDQQVLDNLKKKKDLQYMAMKGLALALENVE
jgi:SNF2 family DNA or RNA helicase